MEPGHPPSGQDPYGRPLPPPVDPFAPPADPFAPPTDPFAPPTDPFAPPPAHAAHQPSAYQPPVYEASAQQYGYTVPPGLHYPAGQSTTDNTLGLLALIFGILAIPMSVCCSILALPAGIAGVVLGILGIKKVTEGRATNRGMALAGAICGGVGAVLTILRFSLTTFVNIPVMF